MCRGTKIGTESSNYFKEKFRPQYHYSPEEGALADPNGLVYFDGEYHLFHQKLGTWAHAISRDLLHWEHMPVAIPHSKLGEAWSGCVVVDWHNSSGFFDTKPGLVAVFTSALHGVQSQSIAYSKDNGRTWTFYGGNPVIPNPGLKDFRDPKVFWYENTRQWIMVVSTGKSVAFYGSHDLKTWAYLGTFGDGEGAQYAVWECPDLFQLPVDGKTDSMKWVLHVSIGDNDITDGSTDQYFIGEFNGTTFINDNTSDVVLTTDFGRDFYAAQSFSDLPDDRRIWIGWMSNWRYPYQSPTDPWQGVMSIPRKLSLRTIEGQGIRLIQEPIDELVQLRMSAIHLTDVVVSDTNFPLDFQGSRFEFIAEVAWGEVDEFGIKIRASSRDGTIIGCDARANLVFVDRTNSGIKTIKDRLGNDFVFGRKFIAPNSRYNNIITIHGFLDECSVEVFVNNGEITFTNLIFPNPMSRSLELYSIGGAVTFKSLTIYPLKSIWEPQGAERGVRHV